MGIMGKNREGDEQVSDIPPRFGRVRAMLTTAFALGSRTTAPIRRCWPFHPAAVNSSATSRPKCQVTDPSRYDGPFRPILSETPRKTGPFSSWGSSLGHRPLNLRGESEQDSNAGGHPIGTAPPNRPKFRR